MATCEERSLPLSSADRFNRADFKCRPELLESPPSCLGCQVLQRGITSFVPQLSDVFRSQPHRTQIKFTRSRTGDLLCSFVTFPKDDGYLDSVSLEFYTLTGT
jgi:hypothetical protein